MGAYPPQFLKMDTIKITIIGPGAIGCLFAGLLVEAGHDVWLLDKHPERAAFIARNGICIEGIGGTRTFSVSITTDPIKIGKADLVIICVKAYDTASAVQSLPHLTGLKTKVFSPQNGLGNVEQITSVIKSNHVFAGMTSHGSTLISNGRVRHAGAGLTTVGALLERGYPLAVDLAEVMTRSGIETIAVREITSALWSKLVINAAIGPLSAISGLPNGELPEHKQWGPLLRQLAEEAAEVAVKKAIRLTYDNPVHATIEVCQKTAGNVSSMLQDVRGGRKTEIEAINGAIVREAGSIGVRVPVNEDMIRRVRQLAGS